VRVGRLEKNRKSGLSRVGGLSGEQTCAHDPWTNKLNLHLKIEPEYKFPHNNMMNTDPHFNDHPKKNALTPIIAKLNDTRQLDTATAGKN
jgi:hypothetical protein